MGLEQRVATLEARSEQQDSKIDALRDEMNRRFGQMQEFNQQTQDLVRAIYFAVKNEQPPK